MGDYASITGLVNLYNEKAAEYDKVQYGYEVCTHKYLNGDRIAVSSVEMDKEHSGSAAGDHRFCIIRKWSMIEVEEGLVYMTK